MDTIEYLGVTLFGITIALILNDLYNEIRKLKARLSGKTSMPHYDNPPAPPRRLFTQDFVERKDKEIKELMIRNANQKEYIEADLENNKKLRAELTAKDEEISNLKAYLHKAKFDYACEVASKK